MLENVDSRITSYNVCYTKLLRPPVLLIVVTLCLIVVKLLTMDIERTAHETRLRILTQRMAAYEAELSRLRAKTASADEAAEKAEDGPGS